MNKIKNEDGITLVALVVTIVVLLILAGVVLNSMQQSGIIGKAQNAKERQEEAKVDEEGKLGEYSTELAKHGIKNDNTSERFTHKVYKGFVEGEDRYRYCIFSFENGTENIFFSSFEMNELGEINNKADGSVMMMDGTQMLTVNTESKTNYKVYTAYISEGTKYTRDTGKTANFDANNSYKVGDMYISEDYAAQLREDDDGKWFRVDGEFGYQRDYTFDVSSLNLEQYLQ